VFVIGPLDGETGASGIDDLGLLNRLPDGYSGGIWTDKIEVIGPELRATATNPAGANP
jgi:glycerophosphoryl diester phosphodiesterase